MDVVLVFFLVHIGAAVYCPLKCQTAKKCCTFSNELLNRASNVGSPPQDRLHQIRWTRESKNYRQRHVSCLVFLLLLNSTHVTRFWTSRAYKYTDAHTDLITWSDCYKNMTLPKLGLLIRTRPLCAPCCAALKLYVSFLKKH
jgi:hypothetical protein